MADDGCYGYMRLTHLLAVCWGLPITRRRIKDDGGRDRDAEVNGHRYAFDRRAWPVWLAHAALHAYVAYYNYLESVAYVGGSFKACFEESYCIAVVELVNRNVGPCSTLACVAFAGRRHKVAALAGTERALAFVLRDEAAARPPAAVAYCSAAVIVAYWSCLWLYTAAVPAAVMAVFCVYSVGQTAVYNLAVFQYYVLERGYARVNRLLETAGGAGRGRDPAAARRSLARLSDVHDHLGRLAAHLNRAYVPALLFKWPYTVVRLVMVVFRVIELSAALRYGAFSRVVAVLVAEHAGEMLLFLFQLICFSVVGARLTRQAERTLASFQKLKFCHELHLNSDVEKTVNIFWIRMNARRVNATIGGFIMINMNFMKAVCGVIATYFLVLIQFKFQKGDSKPLHHVWN